MSTYDTVDSPDNTADMNQQNNDQPRNTPDALNNTSNTPSDPRPPPPDFISPFPIIWLGDGNGGFIEQDTRGNNAASFTMDNGGVFEDIGNSSRIQRLPADRFPGTGRVLGLAPTVAAAGADTTRVNLTMRPTTPPDLREMGDDEGTGGLGAPRREAGRYPRTYNANEVRPRPLRTAGHTDNNTDDDEHADEPGDPEELTESDLDLIGDAENYRPGIQPRPAIVPPEDLARLAEIQARRQDRVRRDPLLGDFPNFGDDAFRIGGGRRGGFRGNHGHRGNFRGDRGGRRAYIARLGQRLQAAGQDAEEDRMDMEEDDGADRLYVMPDDYIEGDQHADEDGESDGDDDDGDARRPHRNIPSGGESADDATKCSFCYDRDFTISICENGCKWCDECIKHVVESAFKEESQYPPSCCGGPEFAVHIDLVAYLFDPDFVAAYKEKEKLYNTPIARRVYCANSRCSRLTILTQDPNPNGTFVPCEHCQTMTCTRCKGAESLDTSGHSCLENKPNLGYTATNRCKQCPNYAQPIELREACNHLTCEVCEHEFCFICLMPYAQAPRYHICPQNGDPAYDEEHYTLDRFKIHRDTGYDREGFNLFGLNAQGVNREGGTNPIYPERNQDDWGDDHFDDEDDDDLDEEDDLFDEDDAFAGLSQEERDEQVQLLADIQARQAAILARQIDEAHEAQNNARILPTEVDMDHPNGPGAHPAAQAPLQETTRKLEADLEAALELSRQEAEASAPARAEVPADPVVVLARAEAERQREEARQAARQENQRRVQARREEQERADAAAAAEFERDEAALLARQTDADTRRRLNAMINQLQQAQEWMEGALIDFGGLTAPAMARVNETVIHEANPDLRAAIDAMILSGNPTDVPTLLMAIDNMIVEIRRGAERCIPRPAEPEEHEDIDFDVEDDSSWAGSDVSGGNSEMGTDEQLLQAAIRDLDVFNSSNLPLPPSAVTALPPNAHTDLPDNVRRILGTTLDCPVLGYGSLRAMLPDMSDRILEIMAEGLLNKPAWRDNPEDFLMYVVHRTDIEFPEQVEVVNLRGVASYVRMLLYTSQKARTVTEATDDAAQKDLSERLYGAGGDDSFDPLPVYSEDQKKQLLMMDNSSHRTVLDSLGARLRANRYEHVDELVGAVRVFVAEERALRMNERALAALNHDAEMRDSIEANEAEQNTSQDGNAGDDGSMQAGSSSRQIERTLEEALAAGVHPTVLFHKYGWTEDEL